MQKLTSIKQLDKEQMYKFLMANDLVLHLYAIGQIKEKPTEEAIEAYFLKRVNEDLARDTPINLGKEEEADFQKEDLPSEEQMREEFLAIPLKREKEK